MDFCKKHKTCLMHVRTQEMCISPCCDDSVKPEYCEHFLYGVAAKYFNSVVNIDSRVFDRALLTL